MSFGLLYLGLVFATSTHTSTQAPQTRSDEPFAFSTRIDSTVGSGSFVADRFTDSPYYSSSLSVVPEWRFTNKLSIYAELSLSYEWTSLITPCYPASGPRPSQGPQQDCADTDDANGRRGNISDLRFAFAYGEIYRVLDFVLNADAGISLPTSIESRAVKNIVTVDMSGRVNRELGPFSFSFGVSATKFFPAETNSNLSAGELGVGNIPVGHCPSYNEDNCLLLSGFLPSWRMGSDLAITFDIPGVEGLTTGLGLSYNYSKRFGRTPDDLSSTKLDANGVLIVDGSSSSDTTGGFIEVSYSFSDEFSAAFGVSSGQPARTENGKSLRFPFYDFVSPANNYSGYYLSFSHSLGGSS